MSTPMDKDLPRRPTDFEMDFWDETGWDESWEEIEPVIPPVRARANAFDDIFDGYGEDELAEWFGITEEDDDFFTMTFDRRAAKHHRPSKRVRLWGPEFDRRVCQLAKSWNCDPHTAECIVAGNEYALRDMRLRRIMFGERVPNRGKPPRRLFPKLDRHVPSYRREE